MHQKYLFCILNYQTVKAELSVARVLLVDAMLLISYWQTMNLNLQV